MEVLNISKESIKKAILLIKKGGVVVFPSDTVYGLLCDATNKKAVDRLFKIKKRSKTRPIGVYAKDIKMVKTLAQFTKAPRALAKNFWPGALTLVLRAKQDLAGITTKHGTIGLRMPDSKLIFTFFKKINYPLAQTSANVSRKPSTTKIGEVLRYFEKQKTKPGLVLDGGDLKKARPSTVVDLTKKDPKILRRGEVTKKDILNALK